VTTHKSHKSHRSQKSQKSHHPAPPHLDIAVLGSGFGGSLIAMIAKQLGRSVVLLERGSHPRFAIGESSTPLANLWLEQLAQRHGLPRLLPLAKWGTWQRSYPQIACGLKRGFTFCHHQPGKPFTLEPDRSNQLLVAASPNDEIADTHWFRPDFDAFLVREAQALGVEFFDQVELDTFRVEGADVRLEGNRKGTRVGLRARFVIDATGPRGFLHRTLRLPEVPFPNLPPTQALYTHFTGVEQLGRMGMASSSEPPPYAIDDAAVHHVFDGGWVWVLRFNNGITSAGIAATDRLATGLGLAEGAKGWARLLSRFPALAEQFGPALPQVPFRHAPRLSFHSGVIAGPQWALLPSAAGFVDPLLSTGFPLTLFGVARLAELIERHWGCPGLAGGLDHYAAATERELNRVERLIAALYAGMSDAPVFNALSLLYFAAASFAETAARLQRLPGSAPAFLLGDHPWFGPELERTCALALQHFGNPTPARRTELLEQIHRAIEPVDVAGFSDRTRRNWYPVRAQDLRDAGSRLGVAPIEIENLLHRLQIAGAVESTLNAP
jgi:tetracycline 7-halogenase / FADH2 O2-dependent halogenase